MVEPAVDATSALTQVDDAEISAFFAADPETIAWPYPMYERWREGSGVVRWEGGPATLVTRHADVKAVMGGAYPIGQNAYRFGELAEGTLRRLPAAQHDIFFKVLDFEGNFMSRQDASGHARLRRISSRAFTARRIEMLRESIQGHVDDLVDAMLENPQSDVKQDLANQLPVRVIVDLIGVPQSDRDMIWEWSEAIGALFSLGEMTLRKADEAIDAFRAYVGDMIHHFRTTGDGPELARLLLDHRDNEAMTEDELVAMYLLILFGGSETTTNLLGNGFAGTGTSGTSFSTTPRSSAARSRSSSGTTRRTTTSPGSSSRTSGYTTSSSRRGRPRSSSWGPRTGTTRSSTGPTSSTSADRTSPTTCPSRSARTTASAQPWPAWRARSSSRRCWNDFPRRGC